MFLPTSETVLFGIPESDITEKMAFLPILSVVAIITTLGMFLTGIPVCQSIKRRGTAEGISVLPFALACVSCFFWVRYGLLKDDKTVVFINVVGLILEIVYTAYFYQYTKRKARFNQMILGLFAVTGAMLFYIDFVKPSHNIAVDHLGMMCLAWNIINFASPLAGMGEVIRTKSAETLPFAMILANFLVAAEWFLYGYLVNDIYMKIPNMIGMILSVIQLSLFAIYPTRK